MNNEDYKKILIDLLNAIDFIEQYGVFNHVDSSFEDIYKGWVEPLERAKKSIGFWKTLSLQNGGLSTE